MFTGKDKNLVVDKRKREVTVDGRRIAWILKGELKLTPAAPQFLSEEEMTILTDYSNDAM